MHMWVSPGKHLAGNFQRFCPRLPDTQSFETVTQEGEALAEVAAVLQYSSLHPNMGDIRSMLPEVQRIQGTSMSSSLQQTWEAASLSMALKQRASSPP